MVLTLPSHCGEEVHTVLTVPINSSHLPCVGCESLSSKHASRCVPWNRNQKTLPATNLNGAKYLGVSMHGVWQRQGLDRPMETELSLNWLRKRASCGSLSIVWGLRRRPGAWEWWGHCCRLSLFKWAPMWHDANSMGLIHTHQEPCDSDSNKLGF